MTINRRSFVGYLGAVGAGAALALESPAAAMLNSRTTLTPTAFANATGRVVVVGGGMAGTSAAKFLRLWGGPGLDVTLVDPNARYTSNIMSNLVLTGQRTLGSLRYARSALASSYGVQLITSSATAVDAAARQVRLADGSRLPYDRVVLAPGLRFDAIPGLTLADYTTRFPHAWQAGGQTTLLREQLLAMPAGGTFVMTIPAAPYRCPPGPYERASVIAAWLTANKPGSKVVVLDANPKILAEPVAFTESFTVIHKGTVEYVPNAVIDHIDPATKTVYTSAGAFRADVLNPIPPHRAGSIAARTGLVNVLDRWVGVDVLSYESTAVPGVHVLGDSIGTTQPKSGHMANAQAKVAADAIARLLSGRAVDPAPATSSACYSPITLTTASWLTGVFQYDPAAKAMAVKAIAEAPSITAQNYRDMTKWFTGLMNDTFR